MQGVDPYAEVLEVWEKRNMFQIQEFIFPVASLAQIVESKRAVGRPKDLLFLSTHQGILAEIIDTPKDGK